ncbi:MAG TPA: LamG domain-containing protein [Kofleriaceae bacterium]
MRSRGVSLLVLAACGFRSPGGPIDRLDAAIPIDAPPADTAPAAPFCDPADPHLVACYELEGDAKDGSSHHLDATTTAVAFVDGRVGQAMQFGAASAASVPDSPAFDIATLTIEAWIRPSQIPLSGRAGIMDVDHQYGFFFYPASKLGCSTGGGPTVDPVVTSIAVDHWSHVACTYDGAVTIVYVDGAEVARKAGTGVPSTSGTTGMSLAADNPSNGSQLIGLIDQVRLMDVARTAAQICADAGKSSCP